MAVSQGDRAERGRILDEFSAVTGFLPAGGKKMRTLGPGSERTEPFQENEAVIMARDGLKM
jgi:hypothetical protein